MHLSQLRNISPIAHIIKPLEHVAQVLHHCHQSTANKAECGWCRLSSLILEDCVHLIVGKLIASQRDTSILVLGGVNKGLRSKETDVGYRDELEWLLLDCILPAGSKDLAEKIRSEVLEESNRAQNRPGHFAARGFLDQMVLDFVLADEMGDGRGALERSVAATING